MRPWEHPSNIHAAAGFPSTFVNFMSVSETIHQLSIRPHDLKSTPINFLSVREKHFVRMLDLSLPSVNFLSSRGSFRQLSSTVLESTEPSVNFRQIFVVPQELLSTFSASVGHSVNISRLSVHLQGLPLTCVNWSWDCGTPCQLSVRPLDLLSTFLASAGPVNFIQLPSITR